MSNQHHDRKLPLFAAAIVVSLGLVAAPGALAQNTDSQQNAAPTTAPKTSSDFSDGELNSFAVAYLDIVKIRKTYAPKMNAADTPEKRNAVQQKAVQNMASAVQNSGLSLKRYNEITVASRSDPDLQKRLVDIITAKQNPSTE